MNLLAYKPNARAVTERLRALYERRATDRIFATFFIPGTGVIAEFEKTHREGECEYPDPAERLDFWDRLLRERPVVEDDSMPFAYLSEMDQGLVGGILGADVRFICNPGNGWISSMVAPLLKEWPEFSRLSFSTSHPWFQRYVKQLQLFVQGSKNRFGICPFVLIDSLNFVFELLGATESYVSLYENPEMVRKAMDFGFEVNTAIQDAFFKTVPLYSGGTFDLGCQWMPGRTVMESVDPFHMASVACFEEWGRSQVERVFARYDGGEVHIHANGRHLLEAVSTLKGLKAIMLGEDTGFPSSFSILDDLRSRTGDVPLVVSVGINEFAAKLDSHGLAGGVFYHVSGVKNVAEANRYMEKVRAYRS